MPQSLIKSLVIGFLPILIYIFAEQLFGMFWGLVVAVCSGFIELIITYFKSNKIEKIILLDLGLLLLFGIVSIVFENDIFFKLKPAIFQIILLVLIGITVFSRYPLFIEMSRRYLKDFNITDQMRYQFIKQFRILFFIVFFHTGLVIFSAFYMSTEWWGFISGVSLYILIGIIALIPLAKMLWKKYQYHKEEWFDIVTTEGKIIGKAPRSICHSNPELIHCVVHLQVLNSRGQLFLQKRSVIKDIQPDKWDTAVGGHIATGEPVEIALKREAEEEIGLTQFNYTQLLRYINRTETESELVYVFRTVYDGEFRLNPNEISEGRFWSLKEIRENINNQIFTPNFIQEFQILMQMNMFKIKN